MESIDVHDLPEEEARLVAAFVEFLRSRARQRAPQQARGNSIVLSIIGRNGRPIDDWRNWTRPKAERHWRAGRSAMELARAWFSSPAPRCPAEVKALLKSRPETAGVELTEGWPEYVTSLPERGQGRNHDLLLVGSNAGSGVIVSVEAKVDEPFGDLIGKYWHDARDSNRPTRAPQRIEALLGLVFGPIARPDAAPWASLRYQLLTAVAGTAIEAARREADTAIVIIHEFLTQSADRDKVTDNGKDLSDFVSVLFPQRSDSIQVGQLYGPVALPVQKHLARAVNLYLGKAVYSWQPDDA